MRAKIAATIGGLLIAGLGFGIGIPIANANQPTLGGGGGACNNYGNSNIIVAPFCGASFTPLPAGASTGSAGATTTTTTTLRTIPPTSLGPRPTTNTPEPTRTCVPTVPGVPCTHGGGGLGTASPAQ